MIKVKDKRTVFFQAPDRRFISFERLDVNSLSLIICELITLSTREGLHF